MSSQQQSTSRIILKIGGGSTPQPPPPSQQSQQQQQPVQQPPPTDTLAEVSTSSMIRIGGGSGAMPIQQQPLQQEETKVKLETMPVQAPTQQHLISFQMPKAATMPQPAQQTSPQPLQQQPQVDQTQVEPIKIVIGGGSKPAQVTQPTAPKTMIPIATSSTNTGLRPQPTVQTTTIPITAGSTTTVIRPETSSGPIKLNILNSMPMPDVSPITPSQATDNVVVENTTTQLAVDSKPSTASQRITLNFGAQANTMNNTTTSQQAQQNTQMIGASASPATISLPAPTNCESVQPMVTIAPMKISISCGQGNNSNKSSAQVEPVAQQKMPSEPNKIQIAAPQIIVSNSHEDLGKSQIQSRIVIGGQIATPPTMKLPCETPPVVQEDKSYEPIQPTQPQQPPAQPAMSLIKIAIPSANTPALATSPSLAPAPAPAPVIATPQETPDVQMQEPDAQKPQPVQSSVTIKFGQTQTKQAQVGQTTPQPAQSIPQPHGLMKMNNLMTQQTPVVVGNDYEMTPSFSAQPAPPNLPMQMQANPVMPQGLQNLQQDFTLPPTVGSANGSFAPPNLFAANAGSLLPPTTTMPEQSHSFHDASHPATDLTAQLSQGPPPQVASQPIANQVVKEKRPPQKFNLTKFYGVKKRTLAFELDPETRSYRGQIRLDMSLKMNGKGPSAISLLEQEINTCKAQGLGRVLLEAAVLAKQVKVVEVSLLRQDAETGEFVKEMTQNFAQGHLADPAAQAKVNPDLYTGLSRHLYQLEEVQRCQERKLMTQGTVQLKLKKKHFQFKNAEKIKHELHFMIDFICEHIADVGGVKCVQYRRELADQLAAPEVTGNMTSNNQNSKHPRQQDTQESTNPAQMSRSEYFFTSDEPNQAVNWIPQLVGTHKAASPWCLQFLVPKDYMVHASGSLLERSVEDTTALHEYEITEADRTVPDLIGFIACPMPILTTPFDVLGKKDLAAAHFLSRQKQSNFNPKLASDIVEYICGVMGQKQFPSKNTKLVFLPNLFPAKFPKQSYNFAGGLHLLDQELLFKPNQIDKRHHIYKQLAGSLFFAFFGAKVREAAWSDTWLLVAIRERIGDRFRKTKCGAFLYRYYVMKRIEKLYKLMREGVEVNPLQRQRSRDPEREPDFLGLGYPDPADQIASDIFFRKCGLVMQIIELKIEERLDAILRDMYHQALSQPERTISLETFRSTYKKQCGVRPTEIFQNWTYATSCPKLTLNYEFNKRQNSLDMTLRQESASASSMRVHKNLYSKVDKIFGMSGEDLHRELLGEPEPNETFNVDQKQACKRWFQGNVNVVIWQTDGGGGEILKQQYKINLKPHKQTVQAHITLLGRVRRTQSRKKDQDILPQAALNEFQTRRPMPSSAMGPMGSRERMAARQSDHDAATNQAAQIMLNQDVQKFEMNEFELEDFPPETKNIFRKELDNNPVLWIRVDPDMEYIRKVKVVQKKRNNWLFQLLREQDIVGQIEAVRQLHHYNEDLVYDILKTVSRNENYFYKVRKEVLKTMHKMEISVFNQYLSHEAFLLRCFNKKNFDEATGFYRENHFTNLLQYYLDRSVLKFISKCKEEKLQLTKSSQQRLEDLQQKQSRLANEENMEDAVSERDRSRGNEQSQNEASQAGGQSQSNNTMIQISFHQNQVAGLDTKSQQNKRSRSSAAAKQHMSDIGDFRVTTDRVAQMLLRVLEQSDNSENYFDDSFLIRDMLASLGRLDNLNYLQKIASEIYRQFKLDQISNSSPQFAVTTGAIKGYFNMRKQIFRFIHRKKQHIDPAADPFASHKMRPSHANKSASQDPEADQIALAEDILDQMKSDIDALLMDELTPLQLRLFIFSAEVKNIIFYRSLPLVRALQVIFDAIYSLQAQMQIRFATYCLRDIVMFLESVRFVERINFTELHVESEATKRFNDTLWQFVCLPHGYMSAEMTFWAKRLINRLYGKVLPKFLINRADMTLDPQILQTDEQWSKTEATLAAEEQQRQQQAEEQKQKQKNQSLLATVAYTDPAAAAGIVQNQQMQGHPKGVSANIATGSKTVSITTKKKNTLGRNESEQQPQQQSIVSIRAGGVGGGGPNRALVKPSMSGITIKALNNSSGAAANEHILSISAGSSLNQQAAHKISIAGTSIRVGAGGGSTPAEAKLQSEMLEVNNQSYTSGTPVIPDVTNDNQAQSSNAVLHIGPQTHTAITLHANNGQQQQQQIQPDQSASQPISLIVLAGGAKGEEKEVEDQEMMQQQQLIQEENGAVMISDDDEDEDSRSMPQQQQNIENIIRERGPAAVAEDDEMSEVNPEPEVHLTASFAGEDDGDVQMEVDYSEQEAGPDGSEQDEEDVDEEGEGGGNDSVYDPFAEEKFDDVDMQKCWLILGKLYYHYESTDFLHPVNPDTFGDDAMYEEYCTVISEPMDIATIMSKVRGRTYISKYQFKRDVELIFDNCREFNEAGTEIVHCANSLTIEFNGLWQEYDMS